MKAVVVKEPGVVEVQDVPEPESYPDEIKIKIAYAGICGGDPGKIIRGLDGMLPHQEGAIGWLKKTTTLRDEITGREIRDRIGKGILGHEASGTIVKIGKDIRGDFKVGQRVAMNYRSTCGACYYCTNGMAQYCERVAPQSGAMTEYSVYRESLVFSLPDDVSLDIGAFLEPLSIAVQTLDISRMKIGDSVIITGGGSIGLLILQLAIKSGASKVIVSEPIAEKRKRFQKRGADVIVDPLKEDLLEISNKVTDGRGYNLCFETSGKMAVARQLILLAGLSGTIVWVASYPQTLNMEFPMSYVHLRALNIHSVLPSAYSFSRALQMLPKLDLKPLITVYPLTEAIKAFEAHKIGKDVKIMLQP